MVKVDIKSNHVVNQLIRGEGHPKGCLESRLFKFCKRKMMFIGFCDIWLSIKESLASISIIVSVEPHL